MPAGHSILFNATQLWTILLAVHLHKEHAFFKYTSSALSNYVLKSQIIYDTKSCVSIVNVRTCKIQQTCAERPGRAHLLNETSERLPNFPDYFDEIILTWHKEREKCWAHRQFFTHRRKTAIEEGPRHAYVGRYQVGANLDLVVECKVYFLKDHAPPPINSDACIAKYVRPYS